MIKKWFFIFLFFSPLWGLAQYIPNFDFENWRTLNYYFPTPWTSQGNITRLSPGYMGSYAIKLQANLSTGQDGQVMYGALNGNQYSGGIPFTSRPDSVCAYFAYNIASGDSASMVVILKNHGNIVGSDTLFITGLNPGFYLKKTGGIHYRNANTPDSVIIGIFSSRPNNLNPYSYLILDNFSLLHQSQVIPDQDFETWIHENYNDLYYWKTPNYNGLNSNTYPVSDTSVHFSGRLSARIMNINQGSYILPGYALMGRTSGNNVFPGIVSGVMDTVFTGYYQYFPQNGDTCTFQASMFRHDSLVGIGTCYASTPTNGWTPFVAHIRYISNFSGVPDSAAIELASYKLGQSSFGPRGNSILLVDEISFNNFQTGIALVNPSDSHLGLSPNPMQTISQISFELVEAGRAKLDLYDLQGQLIRHLADAYYPDGKQLVTLQNDGLAPGLYLLRLETGKTQKVLKVSVVSE